MRGDKSLNEANRRFLMSRECCSLNETLHLMSRFAEC